jgi:hypothetical protein
VLKKGETTFSNEENTAKNGEYTPPGWYVLEAPRQGPRFLVHAGGV